MNKRLSVSRNVVFSTKHSAVLIPLLLFFTLAACTTGSSKTLTIWQTETDQATQDALRRIANDFERKHGNVSVKIESISWGSLSNRLLTAVRAGDPPDISHIQPFMAASLVQKDRLAKIDTVINAIGPNDIYPFIRDLQKFNGHYYGIAHAYNTPVWSYRKDIWNKNGLKEPKDWKQYIESIKRLTTSDRYGAILPGGDPFFIEALLAQFVASNGGRLFMKSGKPNFTSKPVLQTLNFFDKIADYSPPEWTSTKYLDQFRYIILGNVTSVPFTGIRASKQYNQDAPDSIANPNHFALMPPLHGPSSNTGVAEYDGEPFVIFKGSDSKSIAKKFLIFFYQKENYIDYCHTVPIHLSPILKSVARDSAYKSNEFIQKWQPWQNTIQEYMKEGNILPILMSHKEDRQLPFLLEMQGSHILSDMVYQVAAEGVEPKTAAQRAEKRAAKLIRDLGYGWKE